MSTTRPPIGAGGWSIETIRGIVTHHQHGKVGGTRCDAFTAQAVLTLYEALNEPNRQKLLSFPFPVAVHITWGTLKKARAQP